MSTRDKNKIILLGHYKLLDMATKTVYLGRYNGLYNLVLKLTSTYGLQLLMEAEP